MSMVRKVERQIAGRLLSIETGKLAKQAAGAVLVKYGDTVVFATVVSAKPRAALDFFPLTVDYREKLSAAGKFPGGFIKREGRPTTKEILTMRMIDRPLRPLFPKNFRREVQIQAMVWSADQQHDPDILAMVGASAALTISDIPFAGPVGACRVARVDGQFVTNPTTEEMAKSDLDLVLVGVREGVNMIEVGAKELPEDVVADAIESGHKTIVEICDMISELQADCGKEKSAYEACDTGPLVALLEEKIGAEFRQSRRLEIKQARAEAAERLVTRFTDEINPPGQEPSYAPDLIQMALEEFQEKVVRAELLSGRRADGRKYDQIRPLSGEVAVLPRTHGSALFTRGETQSLVTATLGTADDAQIVDGLAEEYPKRFMLHYNFPPFCVGEVRRIGAPTRREIGHGALAERSLEQVLPDSEQFPYTIKLVSDTLESNGSSSMASVCGGTLALMDAGVPVKHPVAGVSIGMVSEGDRQELLTDIIGEEDRYGDMDFKIAGTQKGITGIQLDLKCRALSFAVVRAAFARAHQARLAILQVLLSVIDRPRADLSIYAPKLITIKIPIDMIGKVIGPGGNQVRAIQESTGATVEIEDDGTVFISCIGGDAHLKAKAIIEAMTRPIEIGQTYLGKVVSTKDFGAFLEIVTGKEGMCHVSELADHFVRNVSDVCKVGDELHVKVIAIDEQGRVKLSRKAYLKDQAKAGGSSNP